MFNLFKKKSEVYLLSYEEIYKRINEGSTLGRHSVFFSNAHPSDEAKKKLKSQGFIIRVSTYNKDSPFFEISWK